MLYDIISVNKKTPAIILKIITGVFIKSRNQTFSVDIIKL